jgi:hypothetical protein
LKDCGGGPLVEFTLIFPILISVALGTVDFAYYWAEASFANKAAFLGARAATISSPIATGITDPSWNPALLGQWCFDPTTGDSNGNCPTVNTKCTPGTSGGSCTGGETFDDTAFTAILTPMSGIFPKLQRRNVKISYSTNNLGFVGRPNGSPMNITVQIRCMTHQFFFINGLMRWVFTAPTVDQDGVSCPSGVTAGPTISASATSLSSECLIYSECVAF